MSTFPKIGAFTKNKPISLRATPNGGWIVSQQSSEREYPVEIGAYSTAAEMLEALSSALDIQSS